VSDVLARALAGRDLEFSIVSARTIVISDKRPPSGTVALKDVSGVVKDEEGTPVIGANARIKGTASGTITDTDGFFTLPGVGEGVTLQVSFIGYAMKEVKVAAAATAPTSAGLS
jgi:hypothetical protein